MQVNLHKKTKEKWLKTVFFSMMFILFSASSFAYAAPKSELWPVWNKSNEKSTVQIDNTKWQNLLNKYLSARGGNTLFNYAGVIPQDKKNLEQYINLLTSTDPRNLNKAEQFAYWINLYNALTVNLILDNYPVKSIKNIGGFFSDGPWDDKITSVAGIPITLNDIEHRILRPIWKDSRIHFAVNCASLGCPNLNKQAYNAETINNQLEQAAITFVNQAKGVRFSGNTLYLSSIFEWYGTDFGANQQAIFVDLDQYRKEKKLAGWQGKIKYQYNWNLNQS